ncbi:MAG: hypothetical protein NVS4B11_13560 [Ktedonobacteraceae bacterium]
MADEDQERFEDYLELERYIEQLQAGKAAYPPTDMTPEQARIYQMAALFRSASPENAEPRLAFAEQLKAQLLDAREDQQPTLRRPAIKRQAETAPQVQAPPDPATSERRGISKPARFFSRRGLLAGGAIAAASLVIGVGSERVLEQATAANNKDNDTVTLPATERLGIDTAIPTTWHFVTTVANLGQGAVRFASDTLIGYVIRERANEGNEQIIAFSAACTHMGCIVQWKDGDRHFHCPCHNAMFTEHGASVNTHYKYALPPLPRLNTKIETGKVYVEVPQAQ